MKKILSFFPFVLMAIVVSAQTSVTIDGIKYILDGSSATVTYPNASEPGTSEYTGDIVIPAKVTYNNVIYNVTAIGDKAFRKANISSITLPEGLLTIGEEAFHKSKITSIEVPNSVSKIGHQALSETSTLKFISFGEHIADNQLGIWLCWRSSGGYEVHINSIKKPKIYDNQTFDDTHASTIYVRPEAYDDFMADSKWNIYNIVRMGVELKDFIVDGIKYKMVTEDKVIVTYPTEEKPGSSNPNSYTGDVVIPAQVTYEDKTYDVTGIGDFAFRYATITSISLPEGLTSIGEEAIYNTKITELTLPNSLVYMNTYAMGYNANLKKVTFGSNCATNDWGAWVLYRESPEYDIYMDCHAKPTVPDKYTFDHGYKTRVHVYGDVYSDYLNDEYWGGKYTIVPDMGGEIIDFKNFVVDGIKYQMIDKDKVNVTYLNAEKPGSSNPNLYTGDITIPAQVTYEDVTYSVTGISDYAFRSSTITSISLPEGLLSIGKEAIYKTNITGIVLPNSLTTMGESCISENPNLQTLTFGTHIADKTWGLWVAWRLSGGYNVYMNCDAMPKLPDNQTFDDSHESVIHVYPSLYLDYLNDYYWNSQTIVADLIQDLSLEDLEKNIQKYTAMLPAEDEVGTDPGFYSIASVKALSDALEKACSYNNETSTMEQRNQALLQMIVAANGLEINPLNEGYYYVENINKGQMLYAEAAYAKEGGLGIQDFNETKPKFYFKLTKKGSNWIMQNMKNSMYAGAPVNGNVKNEYITLTENPEFAQVVTWVKGGQFTIHSLYDGKNASLPYSVASGWVLLKEDDRIYWRFHPAQSGMFEQDFNIENVRVREFMDEVSYTAQDATKIDPYNVAPPVCRDIPEPATIFWTANTDATAQQVTWSLNADFSNAFTAEVVMGNNYYEIFNLLPGQTYYYKVTLTVDGLPTDVINSTFTTSGQLRQIKADGVGNLRDLGGWQTISGKPIRYGYIYRGAEWNGKYNVTEEGIRELRALGIKAELDLRSENEALYIDKSPLGDDIDYIRIHNTDYYESGLKNVKDLYRQDLQFVFDCVKNDKPVFFHCHIGADRTGTLAMLLEGLLGVSESDMYKDYEITSFSKFETIRYKENVAGIMEYINTMKGQTLMDKFYTYCHDELGLTAKEIADFRNKMLGVIYDADVKNVVSEAVGASETYIDLSGYDFKADALNECQSIGANVLINVSLNSEVTGQNIINNGICESLVLDDNFDFTPVTPFTAVNATLTKTVTDYGWYSIYLPYSFIPSADVKVYTFEKAQGNSLIFAQQEGEVPACTPLLFVRANDVTEVLFSAENVVVTTEGIEGAAFNGTFTEIPAGGVTDNYILNSTGTAFGKATANAYVPAFHCYYSVDNSSSVDIKDEPIDTDARSNVLNIVIKDATGMKTLESIDLNGKVYNINGTQGEGFGVNMMGNKKYVK